MSRRTAFLFCLVLLGLCHNHAESTAEEAAHPHEEVESTLTQQIRAAKFAAKAAWRAFVTPKKKAMKKKKPAKAKAKAVKKPNKKSKAWRMRNYVEAKARLMLLKKEGIDAETADMRRKQEAMKSLSRQTKAKSRRLGDAARTGKCHSSCKTCASQSYECTSCHSGTFLAVTKYALDGQGKPQKGSETGKCQDPTTQADLVTKVSAEGSAGMACTYSHCRDGFNGYPLGNKGVKVSETRQVACSRVCMVGGAMTKIRYLERTDGTKLAAKYADSSRYSSPVCTFHKVVLCTKPKPFDAKKCTKDDQTGCEACQVKKALKCHAVVPFQFTGTSYTGFTDICNYVKNACDTGARYL